MLSKNIISTQIIPESPIKNDGIYHLPKKAVWIINDNINLFLNNEKDMKEKLLSKTKLNFKKVDNVEKIYNSFQSENIIDKSIIRKTDNCCVVIEGYDINFYIKCKQIQIENSKVEGDKFWRNDGTGEKPYSNNQSFFSFLGFGELNLTDIDTSNLNCIASLFAGCKISNIIIQTV